MRFSEPSADAVSIVVFYDLAVLATPPNLGSYSIGGDPTSLGARSL
jgi:hypothetical protein